MKKELQLSLTIARQLAFGIDNKLADEKLRQIAAFDEAVMENMGEGLYTVDRQGNVTSMNPVAEKMFGWTFEELRGRRMHDVTHYQHADGTPFPIEDCAGFQVLHHAQKLSAQEDVFIRKDGTFFDVIYSSSPLWENGKINGLVVVFNDNTARMQAEKRIVLLAEVSELIRKSEDANELLYAVSKIVGEHLRVRRCLFNEIDLDHDLEIVHQDYCQGVSSVAGQHKISDYSSITAAEIAAGKTIVNSDLKIDPRTAQDYSRSYEPNGERAYIAVPMLRENRWAATLWVSDDMPRQWSQEEVSLLEAVAERTWIAIEKLRIHAALRESEAQLAAELADTKQLQNISTLLIQEGHSDLLYEEILNAVIEVSHSDMGSMQLLDHEKNKLFLLTWKGLHPESAAFWEWIGVDLSSSCGMALRTGKRVIVPDIDSHDFVASAENLAAYRRSGIKSMQTTPLISRNGRILGMISTHWREVHQPSERDLRLLDVLARQAADLIERRRSEEALRASESLYRTIARSIPNGGVYVLDKDFRYVVAEGTVADAFGYSREMLEGHTISEVLPQEASAKMEDRLRRNFAGEVVSFETKNKGHIYWTQQAPLRDSLGHAIIVTVDITERKQAEEALRESEERFRAILSQATAGIIRKDATGKLLFVNQAFCNLLDYTEAELNGKTIWQLTYPDDVEENKRLYNRLMEEGISFKLEKRLLARDGSILWTDVSVSPILDAEGKPQSAVSVYVDITGRKQAEAALQQLNLQLESRVERRTAQLQESHRHLQELSKRLVEVQEEERRAIARELHDSVGQSLSALNLNLVMIRDQLSGDSSQRVGSRLNDSMQLVKEVVALVRNVMADLRPAVLDDYGLEAALNSYIDQFTSRYEVQVLFRRPESLLPRQSPSREMTLLRIAQEALTNIARHAQADQVTVALWQDQDAVHLTVEDNGIGIASFPAAKRPGSHGLNIMRERAEAFDGTLKVESVPGRGTKVEASIPVDKDGQAEAQKERRS